MELDLGMNNIAFDLDGVFVPDCYHIPQIGPIEEFYKIAFYMQPIFKPTGRWSIITARNVKYKEFTLQWINRHFVNKPIMLWHERDKLTPHEYKAWIINSNNITHYVESDAGIVDYLKKHTQAQIIYLDQYLSLKLNHESV